MSAKTVFISYRRDSSGRPFARLLEQALTHEGYDVFLDVDDIDSGKWADQILTQVPLRAHFLLLLTPGALDRCADPNDWVRREFELAVKSGRNIVPVREESVDIGKLEKEGPESMKGVFSLQIATVQHQAFERDVEELTKRYIPSQKAPADKQAERDHCIVCPTRLLRGAEKLFGREKELAALDEVWNDHSKKVLSIVAFGGIGKTSLVIEWMGRQAATNWQGFERVFDWSFFSQGVREQGGASADTFVAAALKFFGDEAMAQGAASAWDKAARLAHLIAERRTLLVLDGVEPLQYPPGPLAGELKDPALATLLKSLAQHNNGLCIVTTRESLTDLRPFQGTTVPEWQLDSLSEAAGSALLKSLLEPTKPKGRRQVKSAEVERLEIVSAVKGHALTLQLLGGFIHGALGDVRKWREVNFTKADAAVKGGYAFKTMSAYEKWLGEAGEAGDRQLAILRVLGLFDRPAEVGCVKALRQEPAIPKLTEPIMDLGEDDWNLAISALEDCGLVSRTAANQLPTQNAELETGLDAHPLIREYFAAQLRQKNLEAWRAGHRRLYEHLCATTMEGDQPTLEDLQPLYQAVAHGCRGEMQVEAFDNVFFARIHRREEVYSAKNLGAMGSDLGATAYFFEIPWSRVSPVLAESDQAWMLSYAAYALRALGRLTEALEPMRAGLNNYRNQERWEQAAASASNLSELDLTLGEVVEAVRDAEESVSHADRSEDEFQRIVARACHADAQHQAGHRPEAERRFREAEQLYAERFPSFPLMSSTAGFQYSDLLLAIPECVAWRLVLGASSGEALTAIPRPVVTEGSGSVLCSKTLRAVSERATKTLLWYEAVRRDILSVALDYLTLGRAALYEGILEGTSLDPCHSSLKRALNGLRESGYMDDLPRGLLTRAWLRFLTGARTGAESAQEDLDEAWEIAERGPMRLHMADIHLYRARLFGGMKDEGGGMKYPWDKNPDGTSRGPKDDLAAARKLIEQCGYWRRKEELEDAEEAAKSW
jgi:tetratricopeptide (TPR) repeat protein